MTTGSTFYPPKVIITLALHPHYTHITLAGESVYQSGINLQQSGCEDRKKSDHWYYFLPTEGRGRARHSNYTHIAPTLVHYTCKPSQNRQTLTRHIYENPGHLYIFTIKMQRLEVSLPPYVKFLIIMLLLKHRL